MVKVVLSFDDGRFDNYQNAFPILNKYNLVGEMHLITGLIDGTFFDKSCLHNGRFLKLDELCKMNSRFDYSSHTDNHDLTIDSIKTSFEKMLLWNLIDGNVFGLSIPHSDETKIEDIMTSLPNLSYLRTGRNHNCYSFINKTRYLFYKVFHTSKQYILFNKSNIVYDYKNKKVLNSIVIHNSDSCKQIFSFIEYCIESADDCLIVFMFHSIRNNKGDKWSFSIHKFEELCSRLACYKHNNKIEITTLKRIYE